FTEGLLLNVGLQCRSILQRESSAVKSLPGLPGILRDLMSLAAVRDLPTSARIRTIAEILEASVTGLARVLDLSTERMPSGLIWYRDPTQAGQKERYRQVIPMAPGLQGEDPERTGRGFAPPEIPATNRPSQG
ncbi:MAG: hypothetical protein ACWGSQ_16720, partial [Longimicrobiales bacterium]